MNVEECLITINEECKKLIENDALWSERRSIVKTLKELVSDIETDVSELTDLSDNFVSPWKHNWYLFTNDDDIIESHKNYSILYVNDIVYRKDIPEKCGIIEGKEIVYKGHCFTIYENAKFIPNINKWGSFRDICGSEIYDAKDIAKIFSKAQKLNYTNFSSLKNVLINLFDKNLSSKLSNYDYLFNKA